MNLIDTISNIPADLMKAIKRISDSGEAEVTVEKTYIAGLTITIKTGADADGLNLEDMSKEELQGKVVWGEFVNKNDRMEYTDIYKENIRKAKEAKNV